MAKSKSTVKLVVTSVILSLIVIGVFALVFINFIVPAYQITTDDVYNVLIKLFPILIGLVAIQIGVMVAKRNEEDFRDSVDKLPPNSYSRALERDAQDDPAHVAPNAKLQSEKNVRIVEKPVEIIKEVPVETIKEVIKEVPVEVVKEVPIEVVKEVPYEVIREVVKEVPVEVIKEVIKEVPIEVEVVKEIPVEIIKEVPVEVIKEIEKEIPVAMAVPEAKAEEILLGFKEVLEEECRSASEMDYDITLALVKGNVDEAALENAFTTLAYVFANEDNFALIFPFASRAEAERIIEEKKAMLGDFSYSTASSKDAEKMLNEAAALL